MLREALRSLQRQTGLTREPEVIVVDNGSADGSVEMLRSQFPRVRLIGNHENRGFCAATNQGMGAAAGEFISLLNNDAVAEPGWLAELVKVFDGQPAVGMAASKVMQFADRQRIDKAGHLLWPDGQNRGRGTGARDTGQFDRVEEVLWPDGCAAMYRRAMLVAIGGFDEDFFAYGDDAELGLRARVAGWRCVYNPRAVVFHHRAATLGLASFERVKLIERNRVLLAVKLFPVSLLWLNPYYYARRLLAGFGASLEGKGEAALFPGWRGRVRLGWALLVGDWAALRMVPRMWRKRAEVDRIRKLSPAEVRDLILANRISLAELSVGGG